MKKLLWIAVWLLCSGLMAHDVYANDTIRWTWGVEYAPDTRSFWFCGTEGGLFGIDWGDGQDTVVIGTGDYHYYSDYAVSVRHTYADAGVYVVRFYTLTADAGITGLEVSYKRLSSLDVSGCAALEYLACYNNALTSLDVSQNVNLRELNVESNLLASLDVSNNLALQKLHCWTNELTSLDVSKNLNLTGLYCGGNRLTALDVSNNRALKELSCGRNQLPFSVVADVVTSLPKTACCAVTPQYHEERFVTPGSAVPMPSLPVIKGKQAHLDVYQNGKLLDGQGYTIVDNQLYFEEIGNYKLVVWHDSVQTCNQVYEGTWTNKYSLYADTTFVTVYSEYVSGHDVVRFTGELQTEAYRDGVVSFVGTAGETFILDWGDGVKSVLEGTGEEMTCTHAYAKDVWTAEARLYATAPTARITSLTMGNQGNYRIKEVKLDSCPALAYLKCEYNELTSLDLSHNPLLTYLNCSYNDLTSLDVSHNPLLTYLECDYNDLKVLDVSQTPQLKYLSCWENDLEALDVSENVNLEELYCPWNHIAGLDVSRNVRLKSLGCGVNPLKTLDVSRNVALEELGCSENDLEVLDVSRNVNLKTLYCAGNKLKTLDLTQNVNLTELACCVNRLTALDLSRNIHLESVECQRNALTSLDVSENVALRQLFCYTNQLVALDISGAVNLNRLICEDNRLETLDVSKNLSLSDLECRNNRLTGLDVSNNVNLYELECANNRLTSLDLSARNRLYGSTEGNFLEVPLDGQRAYDMAALPGMEVDRILSVRGGRLEGARMVFEADEVSYLYATGYQPENTWDNNGYDTVWFCLVADRHDEPQIPLTAEFFPDDVFRAYVTTFDKDGNDSLCGHELAVVREIDVAGMESAPGWRTGSYGVKTLEGLQYFGNLEELYCYSNDLTALDVSRNTALTELLCDNNELTSLDVSENVNLEWLGCGGNRLTALDVSKNVNLGTIRCEANRLPLSEIVHIQSNRSAYGNYTPQYIPVSLRPGQVLDLSREMTFSGCATAVDFGDVAASDYTFADGRLKFAKEGVYQVRLTNDSVRYRPYWDGYVEVVEVFYDITVKTGGSEPDDPDEPDDPTDPDDPDDPDEPTDPDDPDDPDDPTANEDLASDEAAVAPWAYVVGRTVYLTSDGLGEVEAFTAVGQRVYRGHDRAFTVPTAGVYVLRAADGRRCKVMVR